MLQNYQNKEGMCNIVNHVGGQCDRAKLEGRSLKLSLVFIILFVRIGIGVYNPT